jgi:hypothetical protein
MHASMLHPSRPLVAATEVARRRWVFVLIVAAAIFVVAGPLASSASASHFRYGNLTWQKAGPAVGGAQPVTFQNEQAWRASAFGNPAVGDVISNFEGCITFGDGNQVCPQYRVTFVNAADDWVIMHAVGPGGPTDRNIPHTYATAGPFTATTTSCCTISTLNNANDASWQVSALVDLANDDESAKSTVPPIVQLPEGGVQTFTIPAIDSGGETKRFRLTNAQESCFGCLDPQPPGLTINATTGQVSWDTTGRANGLGLWWTGAVVESLVGGNVVSTTQIQYIIRVGGQANNASPAWDDAVTPADGTIFTVQPGQTVTFNMKADDPDTGDTVQIRQNSGPGTLTPTDGNPATAAFSYTAQASDVGNDQTVQFFAQDNGSPPLGPPFRSYTIRVVQPPPTDTTKPECVLAGTGVDQNGKVYIEVRTRDAGSGLASVQVTQSTNANTVVPPFTAGTTNPVIVRGTKINNGAGSRVMLRVTDVAGNVTDCDPEVVLLKIGRKGVARKTLRGVPRAEHKVLVQNQRPGVRSVALRVNGKRFVAPAMKRGATRRMNIASAMRRGARNKVTVIARGRPGSSVVVVLSDV